MSNTMIRPGSTGLATKKKDSRNGRQTHINVNEHELKSASRVIQDRADMNSDIMVLLPELKQAKDIIISSIISPNDFSKKELISDYNNSIGLSEMTTVKIKSLIDVTVKRYKLVDEMYDIAEKALFIEGADVELIIPRSKIESIILHSVGDNIKNRTDLESFSVNDMKLEDIGFMKLDVEKQVDLDSKNKMSLSGLGVKYTGNPLVFATNEAYDHARVRVMSNEWYLDSKQKMDVEAIDVDVLKLYDEHKRSVKERYVNLSNLQGKKNKEDVPFRLKLNSSTVLPLYTDDKTKHIGYFALADEMNRAITKIPSDGDLVSSIHSFKPNDNSQVLKMMVDNATAGMDANKDHSIILTNMLELSENILLTTINETVSNSVYRNNFNLENENSLIRIMLYRALSNMQTSLIFIPIEYMSYIAFDYRRNGTGKTILEDITLLASFKSMLLLSEIYAAVNNNIPVTDVIVDIDEKDPEPFKTKEILEERIYNANSNKMIWGSTDIEKHGSWIQNAGMRIVYNHKTFPDTKITFERKNKENSYNVDEGTSDKVTGMILKALGLSPTILDDANGAEFASVAMINNSLSNKINNERQDTLTEGLSDRTKKLILSDGSLLKQFYELVDKDEANILKAINENLEGGKITELSDGLKVQLVKDIIDGVMVRLPRAENKDRMELADKFKSYMESISDLMDIIKESSYLSDVSSELGISDDMVLNNLKLHFAITWCDEHNYARTLVKFMSIKDKKELKNIVDLINSKDVNLLELAKGVSKHKEKILSSILPKEEESVVDDTTEYSDDEGDEGEFNEENDDLVDGEIEESSDDISEMDDVK